jgi:hypothetical protein
MMKIYYNKYQTTLSKLLLQALTYLRFLLNLLLVFLIVFLISYLTFTGSDKLERFFLPVFGVIILIAFIIVLYLTLKVLPKEKSVTIDKDSIIVTYPYIKKTIIIDFSKLISIQVNILNKENRSELNFTSDKKDSMSEDCIIIQSISPTEWKEIAVSNRLPLILSKEIEESVNVKQTLLSKKFIGDNYYVIQKDFDNKALKISEQEFSDYTSKHDFIKLLGKEELFNIPTEIQESCKIHYSLSTDFGQKSLCYNAGVLIASYEKDKRPIEIEKIASDLNSQYKNIEKLINHNSC